MLADLDGIEADNLLREGVEHLIQDRNASLPVKLPALIDGGTADELPAHHGDAVFAVLNLGK
jgi:hypothetical protein